MIKIKALIVFLFFPAILLAQQRFDIILKNGKIVDGTGNPWFYGDVGVIRDKIVCIGDLSKDKADKIIDVSGLVVAPGFIDVHTHIEGDEKTTPTADNFIYDGVTTVITGNCGSSNTDIGKYFKFLDSLKLSVNVGTLIGHNDIRKEVLGEGDVTPGDAQLKKMERLVEKAMRNGAMGFSTGLEYTPGIYSKPDEIIALAKAAAKYNGVYTSHMRNESDKVFDAIAETIDVGRQAKIPVEISHFKVGQPNWNASGKMMAMVDSARKEGLDVTVDQYPYTASSTTLYILLPDWLKAGGTKSLLQRLSDPALHQKVVNEMITDMNRRKRKHFDYAIVANSVSNPALNGKSIEQINIEAGRPSTVPNEIETILDIVKMGSADMVFHSMSETDVENILKYPLTMIISDSGIRQFGKGTPHPRGYGSNARILAYYVREKHVITLEDAVRKMTSLPAQKFRLTGRGLLQPGMYADIVIFDAGKVKDESTFEHPHAYSTGFKYILVNGALTVDNFKHIGTRKGVTLHGPGYIQNQ
ncbi:MAG TPA: D-aminoacylase [Mucilaginibacter sp.]|jgi:N-acyl-D-amino-acid deacylase